MRLQSGLWFWLGKQKLNCRADGLIPNLHRQGTVYCAGQLALGDGELRIAAVPCTRNTCRKNCAWSTLVRSRTFPRRVSFAFHEDVWAHRNSCSDHPVYVCPREYAKVGNQFQSGIPRHFSVDSMQREVWCAFDSVYGSWGHRCTVVEFRKVASRHETPIR